MIAYQGNTLAVEGVALDAIAAATGTPVYVYSASMIRAAWQAYDEAFAGLAHLVCYAAKANTNRAVLELLARLGSGFDIVSVGELERVLAAGAPASRVVFAGVGKTTAEIDRALQAGVRQFNVESLPELARIAQVAAHRQLRAPVGLRVNPEVDPQTHPYIATGLKESKFGLSMADVAAARDMITARPELELVSLGCHIGSQLTQTAPFGDAVARVVALVDAWADDGLVVPCLDVGGGLGIRYADERIPAVADYAAVIRAAVGSRPLEIVLEPGRSIVGPAGVLLTRVEYVKRGERRNFVVVDAAMNDLMRPSLYEAFHRVEPVRRDAAAAALTCDVVGPVCESGDFLALDRELAVQEADLLAVRDVGAYGFAMSSTYNSRPRAAEVLVQDGHFALIREREPLAALSAGERGFPADWN